MCVKTDSGRALATGLLAWLALTGVSASAAPQSKAELAGVRVRVESPWPGEVLKGFAPLLVDLENSTGEARSVALQLEGIPPDPGTAMHRVVLEAGEARRVELLQRRFGRRSTFAGPYQDSYWPLPAQRLAVEVRAEGVASEREVLPAAGLGFVDSSLWYLVVGVLTPDPPGPVGEAQWSAWISTSKRRDEEGGNARLAAASFEDAPRTAAAYSGLDLLVVDASRAFPAPEVLAGALAWVRTGGSLLVFGCEAERLLAEPALAPWMEERFELRRDGPAVTWRCGHGTLSVDPGTPFEGARQKALVEWIARGRRSFVPRSGSAWNFIKMPAIPGLGEISHRGIVGLLVLFALIIGPLNFFLVKRSGRPGLLLLTIPFLALFCSALLLVYGIFYQGLGIQSGSKTLTVLDQRGHRASTVEGRLFFAGLSPGGLRPAPETLVFPTDASTASGFVEEWSPGGLVLSGDYAPPRRPTRHVLLADAASRLRLVVGEGEVENALDERVEELVLLDAEGRWHRLAAPLAAGGRGALVEADPLDPDVRRTLEAFFATWRRDEEFLPRGSYLARVERSPFQDDLGLGGTERRSAHWILGILEEGG